VVAGRLDAIMILAEFGPNAATAVPDLVPILKSDPSETLRTAAANCLGAIGPKAAKESKDAVPVLIDKVRNDDFPRVKIESAKALALIGAKEALPALMGVLKTEKEDTVITAVKDAIKKLDPDAKLD
jgi:HEAT repeat protein